MGMTLVEKIFARKLNREKVNAGECVMAGIDLNLGTEISAPLTIKVFKEIGAARVHDPEKIVFINDHFVPAKDIASANQAKIMREFAAEQDIEKYYEIGECGICHITLPQKGLVIPGDIIIGTDSHTVTYGALGAFATGVGSTDMACAWATGELWFKIPHTIKVTFTGTPAADISGKDIVLNLIHRLGVAGARYQVLELGGPGLTHLTMADRFTICNMTIECGAKGGIMAIDEISADYVKKRSGSSGVFLHADKDAQYIDEITIDLSKVGPLVAAPYDPANVFPAEQLADIAIDQIVIGSCTNGWIEDFRTAHDILKHKRVKKGVRLILIPGSPEVLKQMIEEEMVGDFIDAGAVIAPSTCGPCIGGHMGVLGDNETGLFTTNRNFVGRNGSPSSKVYLCSPRIAALSALTGTITSRLVWANMANTSKEV